MNSLASGKIRGLRKDGVLLRSCRIPHAARLSGGSGSLAAGGEGQDRSNVRLFHSQNCIGYSARDLAENRMYVPYQTLAVMLLVGLVAGWIAAKVVKKHGMGIAGDVIVGVIGAFIGDWLLPRLGVHLGTGLALTVFNATVGAIVLLVLVRVIRAV